MSMVMWFNEYSPSVKTSVGGKGASLGEMTGAGLPVPPGFALTTAAFRASKEQAGLDAELAKGAAGAVPGPVNLGSLSEREKSGRDFSCNRFMAWQLPRA